MPTSIFMNSVVATLAAAGVAVTSLVGINPGPAYDNDELTKLSKTEASIHADQVFFRADQDGDNALSVDEFAALNIVTAELANLNGFVVVEKTNSYETISLPDRTSAALSPAEHARIDAVSRHTFYAFAGEDGKMQQGEYKGLQEAIFLSSDLNANGALTRAELALFAQRQAFLRPEA
ncbi:hypothetical protein ABFZ85_01890 [Hyphococcus formosus]|uniref:hypothetical protein n=1 Tax=Hyphococcus formosus TaxID=3143534 RepID=UPI00398A7043